MANQKDSHFIHTSFNTDSFPAYFAPVNRLCFFMGKMMQLKHRSERKQILILHSCCNQSISYKCKANVPHKYCGIGTTFQWHVVLVLLSFSAILS